MSNDIAAQIKAIVDLHGDFLAPTKRVRRQGGRIVFDGWYDIPEADCDTHRKVVAWIAHLSEKSWVTPEMIGRFIELTVGREETP